jgi:hypothetical protein
VQETTDGAAGNDAPVTPDAPPGLANILVLKELFGSFDALFVAANAKAIAFGFGMTVLRSTNVDPATQAKSILKKNCMGTASPC